MSTKNNRWAALEEYIDDKLREARRAKRIAEKACAQSPVEAAPPNEKLSDCGDKI